MKMPDPATASFDRRAMDRIKAAPPKPGIITWHTEPEVMDFGRIIVAQAMFDNGRVLCYTHTVNRFELADSRFLDDVIANAVKRIQRNIYYQFTK